MLNSIKTLKRDCKVSLNAFFNKKNFVDDKKILFIDRIFVSNRNFITEHFKIVEIPGFLRSFSKFLKF